MRSGEMRHRTSVRCAWCECHGECARAKAHRRGLTTPHACTRPLATGHPASLKLNWPSRRRRSYSRWSSRRSHTWLTAPSQPRQRKKEELLPSACHQRAHSFFSSQTPPLRSLAILSSAELPPQRLTLPGVTWPRFASDIHRLHAPRARKKPSAGRNSESSEQTW